MGNKEIPSRPTQIVSLARQEGISPEEYIKRIVKRGVANKNPFINPNSKFVVLGIDGFNGDIFPSGSFDTEDEAFSSVAKKESDEHLYSDGAEISTTFHVFTMEGVRVLSKTLL